MSEPIKIMKMYKELIASNFYPFPAQGRLSVCSEQAVYIIYNKNNTVLHVGRTIEGQNGLNRRLYDHLARTSTFRKKFVLPNNISLRNDCKFKYIIVEDSRLRTLLEALTLGLLCPEHIGTGEKKIASLK